MTLPRTLEAALVIGRRDFTATVVSRTFLFFLLGPLFPILFGGLFAGLGANIASQADRATVVVLASPADGQRLLAARQRVAGAMPDTQLPKLRIEAPDPPPDPQLPNLLEGSGKAVTAVLERPFERPRLTGKVRSDDPLARQIGLIISEAEQASSGPKLSVQTVSHSSGNTAKARSLTAHASQALLFLLTLLLATMLLSQLIEEKSNKAIEVLAAAAPVDAIFLGKLFAMLCVSLVGIFVWGSCAVAAVLLLAPGALSGLPAPALGWPGFLAMAVTYFCFGYLLIGGVFLGVGAQASTVREVQTLSMPVTMAQVLIFAFASTAAADPGSSAGLAAALFPLSSPYAMLARAAEDGRWWPHLLAIGWQVLWLWLILRVAAAVFRRSVLKSGPRRRWFGLGRPKSA